MDGPMDEIASAGHAFATRTHPATSRDARRREDATGTCVSSARRASLGNFTRRDDERASAEEDEEEDARRLIDSFPIAIVLGLIARCGYERDS